MVKDVFQKLGPVLNMLETKLNVAILKEVMGPTYAGSQIALEVEVALIRLAFMLQKHLTLTLIVPRS